MKPRYIRFDWAMKRLLRQKANFEVLEGFLSTLLSKTITIKTLLESESNKDDEQAKLNRVDILAEDENGDLFLIEVQNNNETSYFQRMLFGVSKLITEYLHEGSDYGDIKKVYSINIVYFNLGATGKDYIYHGATEFRGLHHPDDVLDLSPFQREAFNAHDVKDIFPEFYLLRVNGFNDVARTPLEEWIAFLRDGSLSSNPQAAGLRRAGEIMRFDLMSKEERRAYEHALIDLKIIEDNVSTGRKEGYLEGHADGRAEGRAEGEREKALNVARKLKEMGLSPEQIAAATGLPAEQL